MFLNYDDFRKTCTITKNHIYFSKYSMNKIYIPYKYLDLVDYKIEMVKY